MAEKHNVRLIRDKNNIQMVRLLSAACRTKNGFNRVHKGSSFTKPIQGEFRPSNYRIPLEAAVNRSKSPQQAGIGDIAELKRSGFVMPDADQVLSCNYLLLGPRRGAFSKVAGRMEKTKGPLMKWKPSCKIPLIHRNSLFERKSVDPETIHRRRTEFILKNVMDRINNQTSVLTHDTKERKSKKPRKKTLGDWSPEDDDEIFNTAKLFHKKFRSMSLFTANPVPWKSYFKPKATSDTSHTESYPNSHTASMYSNATSSQYTNSIVSMI